MKIKITSEQQLIELAESQGWKVSRFKNNHWRFKPPVGVGRICSIPSTPSDWRSLQNSVHDLRKNGLILEDTMRMSIVAEKKRLAKLIFTAADDEGLDNKDIAGLIGQSEGSIKRWRAGGLPKMSEEALRQAYDQLMDARRQPAMKQAVEQVVAPAEKPIQQPVQTPVVSTEFHIVVDPLKLSNIQLHSIITSCIAELTRRASFGKVEV